jgi:hypothetical protein
MFLLFSLTSLVATSDLLRWVSPWSGQLGGGGHLALDDEALRYMDPQGALNYGQIDYSMMPGSGGSGSIPQDIGIPTSLVAAGGVPYGRAYLGASPAGGWQPQPAAPVAAAQSAMSHLPQQHSLSSLGSSGTGSVAAALAEAHSAQSGQLEDAAAAAAAAAQMLAASRSGSFSQLQQQSPPQGGPGGSVRGAGYPQGRPQPRGQYR